jgi:hypothetical protein
MKKLFTLFLILISTNTFAQGNFTVEWESPAGWSFERLAKLDVNSNIRYMIFKDPNGFRIYKAGSYTLEYSFTTTYDPDYIYGIKGERDGDQIQVNEFDVNGDGINEIIGSGANSATGTEVVNPVNGSILYQIPSAYLGYLLDIDDDGYVEIVTKASGKITVTSTPAQTVLVNNSSQIVKDYTLKQNYPNPFNPNTTIEYTLNKNSDVKIIIYDILGREVNTLVNQKQIPGTYKLSLNGNDLSSGTYFYSLVVNGVSESKKMILVK